MNGTTYSLKHNIFTDTAGWWRPSNHQTRDCWSWQQIWWLKQEA